MAYHRSIRLSALRSKYSAKRTTVDNIVFASAKEARRYGELKLLEKADQIRGLSLQVRFPLEVAGVCIGSYVADFCYTLFGVGDVIEDVKGFSTPLYKWKRKHFQAQYGTKITET